MASSNLLDGNGKIRQQFLPTVGGVQNPMTSDLDADNYSVLDLNKLTFASDVTIETIASAPSAITDGVVYDVATKKLYTQTLPVVPSGLVENPMTIDLDAGNFGILNLAPIQFNGNIELQSTIAPTEVIIPIPQEMSGPQANCVAFDPATNKLTYQEVLSPIYGFQTPSLVSPITLPTTPGSGITITTGGTFTVPKSGMYGIQFFLGINVSPTEACVSSYGDLVVCALTSTDPTISHPFLIPPVPNTSSGGGDIGLSGSMFAPMDDTETYTFELFIHNASGSLAFPSSSAVSVDFVNFTGV
jgi:hypothetical protein